MTWKPNIYYSAAITQASEESRRLARLTISLLQPYGRVLTEHIGYENLEEWERNNIKDGMNIFDRDIAWLNDSNVIVADVTHRSTGVGEEIMFGLASLGLPALLLYNREEHVSNMITDFKHPLITLRPYRPDAIEGIISGYFTSFKPTHTLYPRYVAFDAIDGAGKGAIYESLKEWAAKDRLQMFDAVEYWKSANHIPTWNEVNAMTPGCEMLLLAEPTWAWGGKEIRDEIIRKGSPYTAHETMLFFANQRDVVDERLVKPALKAGAFDAKDRWVRTSDIYQPVQAELEGYSRQYARGIVRGLPGNKKSLDLAPGLSVTLQVDPEVAMRRLEAREKKDDVKFENRSFQELVAAEYVNPILNDFYARRGTRLLDIAVQDGETRDETKKRITHAWQTYVDSV